MKQAIEKKSGGYTVPLYSELERSNQSLIALTPIEMTNARKGD